MQMAEKGPYLHFPTVVKAECALSLDWHRLLLDFLDARR